MRDRSVDDPVLTPLFRRQRVAVSRGELPQGLGGQSAPKRLQLAVRPSRARGGVAARRGNPGARCGLSVRSAPVDGLGLAPQLEGRARHAQLTGSFDAR